MKFLSKKPPPPPPSSLSPAPQYSMQSHTSLGSTQYTVDKQSGLPIPPRTPSPTPSDIEELRKGSLDWKKVFSWSTWLKKKYIVWYIVFIVSTAIVVLVSVYHKQLVDWLTPTANFLKRLPAGWTIPIVIMFILSFPPLFGHEIIAVLCGIVWGLWIGFGIVAAGTFLGEVGNFYAFRYCCQARGDKLEKNNISYACLAHAIRDGGFKVALVARFSAIPGHFTTAIFSTCGMGIWEFSLGAFLSLPKQFVTVYLGVIIYESADGQQSTQERVISIVVFVVTTAATFFAMWWIKNKMDKVKPEVLRVRRKQRALAMFQANPYSASSLEAGHVSSNMDTMRSADDLLSGPFNPSRVSFQSTESVSHSSHIPLPLSVKPQRWDADGRAILEPGDLERDRRGDFGYGQGRGMYSPSRGAQSLSPPPGAGQRLEAPDITVTSATYASTSPLHGVEDELKTPLKGQYGFDDDYNGSSSSHRPQPQVVSYNLPKREKDISSPMTAVQYPGAGSPWSAPTNSREGATSPFRVPASEAGDGFDPYAPYRGAQAAAQPTYQLYDRQAAATQPSYQLDDQPTTQRSQQQEGKFGPTSSSHHGQESTYDSFVTASSDLDSHERDYTSSYGHGQAR